MQEIIEKLQELENLLNDKRGEKDSNQLNRIHRLVSDAVVIAENID